MSEPLPITFTVRAPDEYLTANKIDRHWSTKARKVRAWRAAACAAGRRYVGTPLPPCDIRIEFDVVGNIRRDPPNWWPTCKALIDGLGPTTTTTRNGRTRINPGADLWPDDTPEYVTTHEPTFRVVPRGQAKCVTVTLTERAA